MGRLRVPDRQISATYRHRKIGRSRFSEGAEPARVASRTSIGTLLLAGAIAESW